MWKNVQGGSSVRSVAARLQLLDLGVGIDDLVMSRRFLDQVVRDDESYQADQCAVQSFQRTHIHRH